MASSKLYLCSNASALLGPKNTIDFGFNFNFKGSLLSSKFHARGCSSSCSSNGAIPEERIGKPVGISSAEKTIGNNPRCTDCQAKGSVLCTTCAGTGLCVDSILESQGIIVKVRCLGCRGTGNMMCTECGGRGYLGTK